ncbi:chlorogenic acid esterase precursor [Cadophora sp. DSE1049]|nr:chlorogenic acid esterase precursor [Cadophora sp. DSE1049]
MKTSNLSLLSVIFASAYAVPLRGQFAFDDLVVNTTSGILHGQINQTSPGVRQFLGIPFAQPPLGLLRWLPPHPLPESAADRDLNVTALGPSCMQSFSATPTVWSVDATGFQTVQRISEDCLTLSVYAPRTPSGSSKACGDKLLPVIIWMFGGGLIGGGQDTHYFDPSPWIQKTAGHIVVAMNYRVSIFGFPDASGLSDQNLGLMDQRAAVEWARDNVAAFGGDATRMALWGQSAGAISVDYYNYAYHTDPIVSAFMMDSGTALTPPAIGGKSNFTFVASKVGCGNLTASDEVDCMRNLNATVIQNFIGNYSGTPKLTFYPTPDEKVFFANYTERAEKGFMADIPAIIGTNANEGTAMVPFNPNGINETLVPSMTMSHFFCGATETIRLRSAIGLKSYRYVYSGNFTNVSPRLWEGAYHCAELPLLFGTYAQYLENAPPTRLMRDTSAEMQEAWLALVSGGPAAIETTGWSEYTLGGNTVRNFGDGVPVINDNISDLEAQCNGADYIYLLH